MTDTERCYARGELATELVGVTEIAAMRGSTKAAAWAATKHPDFPAPVAQLGMGPVWLRSEVAAFNAVERRPGPKRKAAAPLIG